MPYTFEDLLVEVKAGIWPDGEPENLTVPIRQYFVDALIDLQRWIDGMQENHIDVFPQCSTYFQCGLTLLDAPRGRIRRVWTIQSENYCAPVMLRQRTVQAVRCWSNELKELVDPPLNTGLKKLPLGIRYPDATTDSIWGRSLTGTWAIDHKKIYVAPWIQSIESVVIEWDGFKRNWLDTDIVPDESDLKQAIRLYVQWHYSETWEKDLNAAQSYRQQFEETRADLMYDWREENRVRETEDCSSEGEANWLHRTEDDSDALVTPSEEPLVFAIIGDYGTPGTPANDVAALVKSWGPELVLTSGDNNYPDGAADTIDAAIGKNYRRYIFPYTGLYPLATGESDTDVNRFFPVLGNHDLDAVVATIAGKPYFDYFTLPNNERYYDVVWGNVHFFMLNSGINTAGDMVEQAGNSAASVQAEWLQGKIAQSTALWKVVIFHHPPYTSRPGYSPGITNMRWNFKAMGVDVVINGHAHSYERIEVDGFTYLVNGAGGSPLVPFNDNDLVTGSEVHYDSDYGALRGVATNQMFRLEFVNTDGVVIDSFLLKKPCLDVVPDFTPGTNGGSDMPVSTCSTAVQPSTFDTLVDMRAWACPIDDRLYYLSGLLVQDSGDGGGYIYRTANIRADDGLNVIIPNIGVGAYIKQW